MTTTKTDDGRNHALVTGGAGFVGSHLVDTLLADGHVVTVCDNFGSGQRSNLSQHDDDENLRLLDHDIRDPFPDIGPLDRIYHFASRASPTDFEDHAVEIALTNSAGTRRVFDLALETDARVVLASTSEIYGNPETHPQTETYNGNVNPRGPRAPYDESKRFAEALGVAYQQEHDVDIRTVRIFNTYGPRIRLNDGRVVPTFIRQALDGADLTVYGDGEQTRSFCYVSDLVAGIRSMAEANGLSGEVVNLGSTAEITIQTLAETILDLVETDSGITYEARPTDDPDIRRPDISRAQERLNWSPEIDLETGLSRTIDYYRTRD